MNARLIAWLSAGLLTGLLNVNPVFAEDHKSEATKQALAAAESGKKGDLAACAAQAAAAKTHAEAAQAEKSNPHLSAGIKNLNEAIEQAKQGHSDAAGEAADAAATHLNAADLARKLR